MCGRFYAECVLFPKALSVPTVTQSGETDTTVNCLKKWGISCLSVHINC